jgi:bacterioferritin
MITMNATVKKPQEKMQRSEKAKIDEKSPTTADRQALIDGLNRDLAGEYQAILMYTHFSAKLTGPFRRELRALFQTEIADEQGHAQFLADKIAAMSGEPITEPMPVPHVDQPRQMLDSALDAEVKAIANYTARIGQAGVCGELGLKVQLETQLADETRHKEELERIIAGWYEFGSERAGNEDRWQSEGCQR